MEEQDFRVLIKHCYLMKKSAVEAQQWIENQYPTSAPSKSTVYRWYSELKCSRTVSKENISKILRIIMNDRKVKLREIADTVKIPYGSVSNVLNEHLLVKKLCGQWMPRTLTVDQKYERVSNSEHNLKLFRRDKKNFLRRFVTMDYIWIYQHTPEDENCEMRPKKQQSPAKILVSVFWDAQGVIFIDYLENGTKTPEYCAALLGRLNDEIKEKRPKKTKVLYHHDCVPVHQTPKVMGKLNELKYELIPHPEYSPDLAPSNYYLFANMKRWLPGKQFTSTGEVKAQLNAYFEDFDESYFSDGIEMLENRWTKCIVLKGNYVEE